MKIMEAPALAEAIGDLDHARKSLESAGLRIAAAGLDASTRKALRAFNVADYRIDRAMRLVAEAMSALQGECQ